MTTPATISRPQLRRVLRQRQQTLAHFEHAQEVPQAKARLFSEQVEWITQLLAGA